MEDRLDVATDVGAYEGTCTEARPVRDWERQVRLVITDGSIKCPFLVEAQLLSLSELLFVVLLVNLT